MTYNFHGKVALVTGGSSGIGKATSLQFAQCGASLIILDKGRALPDDMKADLERLDVKFEFISCDVSSEHEVSSAITNVINIFGRLDFAYNNAGVGGDFSLVENYPTSDWDFVMDINLKGVFLCMKYEIPAILKSGGGAIVNCASLLSTVASEKDSAYVASKFGVLGLTKNAALEYASSGLRINSISPGFTRTPMIDHGDEEKLSRIAAKHPIGRLGTPEEMANGVLWLCSDQSSFAIGLNLLMDGGYTLS